MAKKGGREKGDQQGAVDLGWAAEPAELLTTDIEFMRPTQGAVGYLEVGLKVREIRERAQNPLALERYLAGKPIPAVMGPDSRMYLVDRHHMGLALTRLSLEWDEGQGGAGLNPYRKCHFNVIGDYSGDPALPLSEFFLRMEAQGLCHPFNGAGERIGKLPRSLLDLENDPHRSLAGIARKAGAYEKVPGLAYQEFQWADFFRTRIDASRIQRDNLAVAIKAAVDLAAGPGAVGLPGSKAVRRPDELPSLEQIKARLAKKHGQPDASAARGPDLPAP